jgi:SET domain-containing protein
MTSREAKPLIEVRSSPIHGNGVYALRRLPQGTCLGTYDGRRYTAEALLAIDWDQRHRGLTYLFALSDGTTIDGGEGSNDLRFLNHACRPNCEAQEVQGERGELALQLVTLRAIPAGSELTLDYCLTIDEQASPDDYPCRCDLPDCRGTMAAVASA